MKEARNATDKIIDGIHYATGRNVSIMISEGIIESITEVEDSENTNVYLAPGLIDNQINGYANVDFSGSNLSTEGVAEATKAIWGSGVTTFMPTLLTNSHENLLNNFTILEKASRIDGAGQSIAGFHLEGPYISPVEGFRGCHLQQYTRKPSWDEFLEYQEAAGGKIIQVTLAPEIEGAMEFISKCTRDGIIVALGHTNASAEIISRAVNEGARLSTHLGNGCANLIHRHNNPIWPQLANDNLIPSIIADGHHLTPDEINVFFKVKGVNKLILTSDVVYLAGMTPGTYTFLGTSVILTPGGMLINPDLQCLAGASFPLITGVGNMMKLTGCSLHDAIKMASSNVSEIYGLTLIGDLLPGKKADIIKFEKDVNAIRIMETWKNGNLVFKTQE
jgi:N-acetylglucosamine-6-phosphate deacetylase